MINNIISMSIGIYKITSPNNKVYIGQSINIEIRKKYYLNLNKCKKQPKLYNSLKKYGFDQHIFEIIEECNLDQLNEREIYWKQYYLNQVNGDWDKVLFCNLFDTGGGPKTEEHRKKISKSRKGRKYSDDTKRKMSDAKKGRKYNENHKNQMSLAKKGNQYRLGSKMSDEAKYKISKANSKPKPEGFKDKIISNKERGYKISLSKQKSVLQYDLHGNFIKEWSSAKEAELYFGKGKADNIAGCCRGISKTAYKYKWTYK